MRRSNRPLGGSALFAFAAPWALAVLGALAGCGKEAEPDMPQEPVRTPRPQASTATGGVLTASPAEGDAATAAAAPSPAAEAPAAPGGKATMAPVAKPGAKPGAPAKPGDTKPVDAKVGNVKPSDAKTGEAKPAEAKGGDAKVEDTIERWRHAWERKSLGEYLTFYAPEFKGDKMDLAAWSAHKKQVFAKAGEIHVVISDLKVTRDGDVTVATFTQTYTSGTHTDRGKKELRLRRQGDGFRILSESFAGK